MPEYLSINQAAESLGITTQGVRLMISRGRMTNAAGRGLPAMVTARDIERVRRERRREALSRTPSEAVYAASVLNALHPPTGDTVTLADGREAYADARTIAWASQQPRGQVALDAVLRTAVDATALWGRDAVIAAAINGGACRWCFARNSASVHGRPAPEDAPALRVLLGTPCPVDLVRWQSEADIRRAAMSAQYSREQSKRQASAAARARGEFSAAKQAAQDAASRLGRASASLAAVDPNAMRQVAIQGRIAAGYSQPGDLVCGCTTLVYCQAHRPLYGTADRTQAGR